jgi:hypothetical protein
MRTRSTRPEYPWNPDRGVRQIVSGLFVAGEEILDDETFLLENNISYVLSVTTTVTPESNNNTRFQNVMHIKVEDHKNVDIASHFKPAIEFITYARMDKKAILVHCQQGVSRSGAIILAYLMFQLKSTLYQVWHYVEGICGKHADPNLGFQKQLLEFQSSINNYTLNELEEQFAKNERFKVLRKTDEKYVFDKEENYLKNILDAYHELSDKKNEENDKCMPWQHNHLIHPEITLDEYLDQNVEALDLKNYHFNIDPYVYNPKLQKLMKQKLQLMITQEEIDNEIEKQMSKL